MCACVRDGGGCKYWSAVCGLSIPSGQHHRVRTCLWGVVCVLFTSVHVCVCGGGGAVCAEWIGSGGKLVSQQCACVVFRMAIHVCAHIHTHLGGHTHTHTEDSEQEMEEPGFEDVHMLSLSHTHTHTNNLTSTYTLRAQEPEEEMQELGFGDVQCVQAALPVYMAGSRRRLNAYVFIKKRTGNGSGAARRASAGRRSIGKGDNASASVGGPSLETAPAFDPAAVLDALNRMGSVDSSTLSGAVVGCSGQGALVAHASGHGLRKRVVRPTLKVVEGSGVGSSDDDDEEVGRERQQPQKASQKSRRGGGQAAACCGQKRTRGKASLGKAEESDGSDVTEVVVGGGREGVRRTRRPRVH